MEKSASVSSESNVRILTKQHPPSAGPRQCSLNNSIIRSESRRRSDNINNPHPPSTQSLSRTNVGSASESPLQSLLAFTVPQQKREDNLSKQASLPPMVPHENRQRVSSVTLPESPSLELLSNIVPYTWLEPPMPVVSHRNRSGGEFSPSLAEEWTTQVRKQRQK